MIARALGLLLAVVVHPANEHDSQTAPSVLKQLLGQGRTPEGDFYRQHAGGLPDGLVWRCFRWPLSIVEPQEEDSGFDPLPKRWVIERTFGWFGGYRRLIRDYERLPEMSEAMVRVAMIRLMIRRVT